MNVRFEVGDLTKLEVEAIVNPANSEGEMGGGLAAVLKRRGGKQIELEAMEFAPIGLGSAVITTAGKLGADYMGTARLINTMVWGDPSTLAHVENGTLSLQGLHAFRHGNGLQVRRGGITAVNVNFFLPGGHLSLADTRAKATLIGNITRGPLILNGKPMPQDSPAI